MSNQRLWVITVIAVCALCTLLERALPFLIFRGKRIPDSIRYLGKVLPMAIMTTLVFYCIRNITFGSTAAWVPQILSCAVTALLHLWKGNTMISIAGGTICCMVLTQFVFI